MKFLATVIMVAILAAGVLAIFLLALWAIVASLHGIAAILGGW